MPMKMTSERASQVARYTLSDPRLPGLQALAVLVLEMRDEISCLRGRIAELENKQPETANYDDEMEVVNPYQFDSLFGLKPVDQIKAEAKAKAEKQEASTLRCADCNCISRTSTARAWTTGSAVGSPAA